LEFLSLLFSIDWKFYWDFSEAVMAEAFELKFRTKAEIFEETFS
jgi:hypothetical protein